jgi:putative ABC transport system permease protein
METLRIAIRNITRNERRSRLTIVTIVIGVAILMNVQGVFRGLASTVYSRMMAMDTAQVQVEAAAYREEARRLPLDLVVEDSGPLAAALRRLPGVAAVSERIDASFEVTNGRQGARAMARGISREEAEVTDLGAKLVAGSLFRPGESGIVIGTGMAAKLGLAVGDIAYFSGVDKKGARNLGSARVLGVFEYGYPLLDDYMAFIDIDQARAFLGLGTVATRLVVRGTDPGDSAALTRRVAAALAAAPSGGSLKAAPVGESLKAYEWKVFAENLVSTIESRLKLVGTIIGVLFVLIIAGIFNTMAMNVQERSREIGTMRAIGIRRSRLQGIFVAEGLAMGAMGCAIAAVPALVVGLLLGVWGIDISGILPADIPIPFGSVLKASYTVLDALRAVCAGLGAAVLGSIVPAYRAARLPITDALGTAR